jgi:hypothetical protein
MLNPAQHTEIARSKSGNFPDSAPFLTVEQIAEEWQVPKSTVYGWCQNPRELKPYAFKVGKHVRVDPDGHEIWKQKKWRGD